MGVSIGVTLRDHSSAELRSLARTEAGALACRILAIAHVLDGASRTDSAALCEMDRPTLVDWVHRFNADGIEGLANKAAPDRILALSDEQMAELKGVLLAGPDVARPGQGWRGAMALLRPAGRDRRAVWRRGA